MLLREYSETTRERNDLPVEAVHKEGNNQSSFEPLLVNNYQPGFKEKLEYALGGGRGRCHHKPNFQAVEEKHQK